jgi:hypothetical protein
MDIVIAVQRDADLPEIVRALHTPRRLPRRLHGGQQEPDQDADDRDDNEQLNQREPAATCHGAISKQPACAGEHLTAAGLATGRYEKSQKRNIAPESCTQ